MSGAGAAALGNTEGPVCPADLRVGVVGVGGIGRTHLRAYADAGTPAVAVTDVDAERAADAAAEFGATAYPDLDGMLAAGVDAISVCTPPAQHRAATAGATMAGVAVLCEKPLGISVDECEEMAKTAREADTVLSVGFCHRFQPHVQAMRAATERGDIGTLRTFHNRFSASLVGVEDTWFSRPEVAGGGVCMDTSIHSVDLFRHLAGEIASVRALTSTTATPLGPALDVEDTVAIVARSESGVIGTIEASWRTLPPEASITLYGTDGALHLNYATLRLTRYPADGAAAELIEVEDSNRFTRQAAHFLASVCGQVRPATTADDGTMAVAALTEVYRSATPGPGSPTLSRGAMPQMPHTSS